mmetsp:Transcript_26190/g.47539  ORF Transcript_26190/g.47539 Transcript_26190/m.47539 type:complete len:105 (-) Transcript_26190:1271-1585(-)
MRECAREGLVDTIRRDELVVTQQRPRYRLLQCMDIRERTMSCESSLILNSAVRYQLKIATVVNGNEEQIETFLTNHVGSLEIAVVGGADAGFVTFKTLHKQWRK